MKKIYCTFFLITVFVSCKPGGGNKIKSSPVQYIDSPADSISAEPYLFTGADGTVYLSWITKDSLNSTLYFSALKNENWTQPAVIASGNNWFVNWADYPLIAALDQHHLISHFLEKSDTGKFTYDVKISSSIDGGKSWKEPFLLHDDGKKAEHGFVSMVPFKNQFFVAWLDGRNTMQSHGTSHSGHGGQMTIRAAILDKTGNKINEWELDDRVCDCCQTSAAITDSGPVVVYRDRSENEVRDISIVRWVNDQWTKPVPIYKDNWKIAGCPVNGPRIDALGNHVVVAWFSSQDKNGRVKISFSNNGGAVFQSPIRVDEGETIGRVDVCMLDTSSAIVCWMEGPDIKAVRVNSNGQKEKSITIGSSSESRSAGFPQITKWGNKILFAWTDSKLKTIKLASLVL